MELHNHIFCGVGTDTAMTSLLQFGFGLVSVIKQRGKGNRQHVRENCNIHVEPAEGGPLDGSVRRGGDSRVAPVYSRQVYLSIVFNLKWNLSSFLLSIL